MNNFEEEQPGNWWFKKELGPYDMVLYQQEGVNTIAAVDLASFMFMEDKKISCLRDVKREYALSLSEDAWEKVNEVWFNKLFKLRCPKLQADFNKAQANRENGKKVKKKRSTFDPSEVD